MARPDHTTIDSHYEFGANWEKFAQGISEKSVAEAQAGLARLFPDGELAGKRVIDIGCGSGLHSLAALKLGASELLSIDIDPKSVATTDAVLRRFFPGGPWRTSVQSVFDMPPDPQFDVVYSWGVLHHTGDMARAIAKAVAKVAPGGLICLALYRKTPMCWAWKIEKRLYTGSPRAVRSLLDSAYTMAARLSYAVRGWDFDAYVRDYVGYRGMDFMTDVRDWLGGFPYESISEREMLALAASMKLEPVRRFCRAPGWGFSGTGCDEYVFRRARN
ncbi:MAG TPA: methyltransferase domain-containing protein [Gemmatimonadaceae bacterium]|nr:methyltransferase domain-containing protein [Gemmatimonadaceae bacterium]